MKHPDLVKALEPITSRVRTDVCWRKTGDGPRRIDSPLTAAKLDKHVNGGPAYGAAPILPGQSTTLVAVLDLDSHKGETPWADMLTAAGSLMAELEAYGMAPLAFRSTGGLGLHIYLLWDVPQDAYSVRVLLQTALDMCGFKPGDGGVAKCEVEIFPKQNSVAEGKFGNMFILPLAGASVPLCPLTMADLDKADAAGMDWPVSPAVPVLEREVTERSLAVTECVEVEKIRAALAAIANDGEGVPYDQWRDLVFAVHQGTGGTADGLALMHEFSARSSKYAPEFLDERVWPYISDDNGAEYGAITVGTLWKVAREHGWQEPIEHEFDVVPAPVGGDGEPVRDLPRFRRNDNGGIVACAKNLQMALHDPRVSGVRIRFDEFRAEVMLAGPAAEDWRSFTDADYTRLTIHLEAGGFGKIAKEMLRDVVWLVADENRFDSAREWIGTLQYDGRARIDTFLARYMGADDTPYTRAVSRYLWTALAGRVLSPGCEAPMVPVFIGEQGAGKTRAVKALSPALDFFTELNLAERDAEASRRMRGRLVIELGELRGLHTKDAESIKAFISRTHEEWRVLYKEFNTTFARRFLFVGTTNQNEFLGDETGERRWLPARVGRCDVAAVQRDVLQLWAEGRDTFLKSGIDWAEAEALARGVHHEHKISDPWLPAVESWLSTPDEVGEDGIPAAREFLHIADVLQGAIRLAVDRIGRREELRIGKILRELGYVKVVKRVGGKQVKVWVREP